MFDDLANVTTVRIPLTGEPLENHDRFLDKRRRDRTDGRPSGAEEVKEQDAATSEDEPSDDEASKEEPHQLDVNA